MAPQVRLGDETTLKDLVVNSSIGVGVREWNPPLPYWLINDQGPCV